MNHSGREDRKLSEVKAVLQRLQGLSNEPDVAGLRSTRARLGPWHWIGGGIVAAAAVILAIAYALPHLRQAANSNGTPKAGGLSERAATRSTPRTGRDGSVGQTATDTRRVPPADAQIAVPGPGSQPAQPKVPATGSSPQAIERAKAAAIRPALEAALALMTSGRVQAARQRLLAMASGGSPDVAWALARSYDPNYLSTIPAADAGPDVVEATRWYRSWYAAAVKQGLVADSVSLERIIGSMQR